jgi:type IV secretory pathway VirJ component
MKRRLFLLAFVFAATALCVPGRGDCESFDFGAMGKVELYRPASEPRGVVLFLSGDGGWKKGVEDMAKELARHGAVVAGIDTARYLRSLDEGGGKCSYPAADLEALSKYVQMRFGLPRYLPPVLAGYSSGATLVYAVLAQSPPNTFAGAISLGFCPDLRISKPLCRGRGLEQRRMTMTGKKGYALEPAKVLSGKWTVLQGESDQVCAAGDVKGFADRVPGTEFVLLSKAEHGFAVQRNWLPQLVKAYRKMIDASQEEDGAAENGPMHLPVVELPAKGQAKDLLAVILSGDGGWAGIDREIGEDLSKRGIGVAGLNSLRYFWKARTPDSTATDVSDMLRHYLRAWNKSRVVLIGYSFGADVLPFVVNRLPGDLREAVQLVVLIGPDKDADFEFHLTDWLGGGPGRTSLPILPEVKKVRGMKMLCMYGSEETRSPCRDMDRNVAETIELKGGHHFGGHYSTIVDRILQYVP